MTKVKVSDWQNLPYEKWSVTTVRAYLREMHEGIFGIPYVTNSHAMEGRLIKSMLAEHGGEVVKYFINACIAEYKPTRQYPGLNFAFMYSYMKGRNLPRVLLEIKKAQLAEQQPAETGEEEQIDSEWW